MFHSRDVEEQITASVLVRVKFVHREEARETSLAVGRTLWGMLCHLWTPSFFTRAFPFQHLSGRKGQH